MPLGPAHIAGYTIDTDLYLKRIGLEKEGPSLQFLKKLHRNHLLSIPFENLDIHYKKRIELKPKNIFEKLMGNRGGFCFELNGIFLLLLKSLGFNCWYVSSEVKLKDNWSPEFDHIMIVVNLNDAFFLVDVGFGELFAQPLKLAVDVPQVDYNKYFRFKHDPDERWLLQQSSDNALYETKYRFNLEPKGFIQFLERCNYHQDSANSHFSQNKLITQLFPNGRITLTSRKLLLGLNGENEEINLMNEEEFLAKAQHHFGIDTKALILQRFQ